MNYRLSQRPLARPTPPRPSPEGREDGDAFITRLAAIAPGRVWIGVTVDYGRAPRHRIARRRALAESHGLPLIAVGDVIYHAPERRRLQDVLTCIRHGITLDEAGRRLEANAERHLKPAHEMARLFREASEAIELALIDKLGYAPTSSPSTTSCASPARAASCARAAARRPIPPSATASASPRSIPTRSTCCSSASSRRSARSRPTSTSISSTSGARR
jgi:hypothetical protein